MDWFKGSVGNGMHPARQAGEFHRIKSVRQKLGVELAELAQTMGISLEQATKEEDPLTDLNLTQVHRWQRALNVPFRELLIAEKDPMALPGLTTKRLEEMHRIAEEMIATSHDSNISTFASELARQFSQLVDSAEQPFLEALASESSQDSREVEGELDSIPKLESDVRVSALPFTGRKALFGQTPNALNGKRNVVEQFSNQKLSN